MVDFTHRMGLWLQNDESIYRSMCETGREALKEWRRKWDLTEETREDADRYVLNALESAIDEMIGEWANEASGLNPMMQEMLDLAVAEIDTRDLAAYYLEDVFHGVEYDATSEGDAEDDDSGTDDARDREAWDRADDLADHDESDY